MRRASPLGAPTSSSSLLTSLLRHRLEVASSSPPAAACRWDVLLLTSGTYTAPPTASTSAARPPCASASSSGSTSRNHHGSTRSRPPSPPRLPGSQSSQRLTRVSPLRCCFSFWDLARLATVVVRSNGFRILSAIARPAARTREATAAASRVGPGAKPSLGPYRRARRRRSRVAEARMPWRRERFGLPVALAGADRRRALWGRARCSRRVA
jgi:hypothetical protein